MSMFASPEAAAKAEAEYQARVAEIDAAVATCPQCKAAKTRKANKEAAQGRSLPGMKSECSKHRSAYRLAYVCSPVSETYWAS